ncbi:MAG TPA: hypothetical protein VNE62_13225 [Actinomycetota bacterium]|nr:hypothetical protein [Actinomycetota bacterium]
MPNRVAFRALAAVFAVPSAAFFAMAATGLGRREVQTTSLFYALLFGACAAGLWTATRWGRTLALLVSLGNAGVATLGLLATLVSSRALAAGPAALLVISGALAYLLTRRWFALPGEDDRAVPGEAG